MVAQVMHDSSGVWTVMAHDVTVYMSLLQEDATNWARNYLRFRGGGQLVICDLSGREVSRDLISNLDTPLLLNDG